MDGGARAGTRSKPRAAGKICSFKISQPVLVSFPSLSAGSSIYPCFISRDLEPADPGAAQPEEQSQAACPVMDLASNTYQVLQQSTEGLGGGGGSS